jgi:hypothetical protein
VPVDAAPAWSAAWVQVLVIQWEVVLGVWLLTGRRQALAWPFAVGTFSVFALASGHSAWQGRASCGCLGVVRVDPRVTLTLDVVVLTLMGLVRPRMIDLWTDVKAIAPVAVKFGVGTAVTCVAATAAGVSLFGSGDVALARLRGETVVARPAVVAVGTLREGDVREVAVELVNRTTQPVMVYGGTGDCSCLSAGDLPVTLAPGQAEMVSVRLQWTPTKGTFARHVTFDTDCPLARQVSFRLVGRMQESE